MSLIFVAILTGLLGLVASCSDPGISDRGGGGGAGQSNKKALTFFFFSPQLNLQKSNG